MPLDRRSRIRTPRVRGGGPVAPGAGFSNFGRTLTNIAGTELTQQRVREAEEEAQKLIFERDQNGNVLPPQLPEDNGRLGPTIFEAEYTRQVLQRYVQEVDLDGQKNLADLANEHILDPDGFQAAADAYIESTANAVLPQVRGSAGAALQRRAVTHYNFIARNRAQVDFRASAEVHQKTIDAGFKELAGLITSGGDTEMVIREATNLRSLTQEGIGANFYAEDAMPAFEEQLKTTVARASMAAQLSQFPATPEGDALAMKLLNDRVEGSGTVLAIEGGQLVEKPVTEVFPDIETRRAIMSDATRLFAERSRARDNLQAVRWEQDRRDFIKWQSANLWEALRNGKPLTASLDEELDQRYDSAMRSGNFQLLQQIDTIRRINWDNTRQEAEAMMQENQTAGNLRALGTFAQWLPAEAIERANRYLSEKIPGWTIYEAFEGRLPDSKDFPYNKLDDEVQSAIYMALGTINNSGRNPTRLEQSVSRQLDELTKRAAAAQNEFMQIRGLTPETMTPEDMRQMTIDVRDVTGVLDVPQTEEAAVMADDFFTNMNGGEELDWATMSLESFKYHKADKLDLFPVIPATLSEYMNGFLNHIGQGGNIEQANRILDMFAIMDQNPRLSYAMQQSSALGKMTDGLRYITRRYPPGSRTDGEMFRSIMERSLRGDDLYGEWKMGDRENVQNVMSEYFQDLDFHGVWNRTGQQVPTFFGTRRLLPGPLVAPLPLHLQDLVMDNMVARAGQFDSTDEDSITKMADTVLKQVLKDNHYTLGDMALNEQQMGFEHSTQVGEWFSNRPRFAFARNAPESFYYELGADGEKVPDGEKIDRFRKFTQNIVDAYSGMTIDGITLPKLKIGRNVFVNYDSTASDMMGSVMWQIVVPTEGGGSIILPAEDSLRGATLRFTFDPIADEIDKERNKHRAKMNEIAGDFRRGAQARRFADQALP